MNACCSLCAIPLLLSLTPADAQELTTATLDAGGSLTNGGSVEISGSLGGFAGVSEGDGNTTARAGFPGQLYNAARLEVSPGSAALTENSLRNFRAEVVCDDDSVLTGEAVAWSVDSSLLAVSAAGDVTTGLLPNDFFATLTASGAGVTGRASLQLFDTTADDFDAYAGDGLPDSWQVNWFGYGNPDADPAADQDSDGQNNQTEYLAGTDPVDAASFLHLAFADGTPPSGTRVLLFSPYLPDRTYTLESSSMLPGPWVSLPGTPSAAAMPGAGLISDTAAMESRTFYRLRISVP